MNKFSVVVLSLATLSITACQSIGEISRSARVNPASASVRSAPDDGLCPLIAGLKGDRQLAIDLNCFQFDTREDSKPAYLLATTGPDKNAQRLYRNRLASTLIDHANQLCEMEKGTLYATRSTTGAGLDFLSSSFSIASTIVGGEQAKSILSGAAGLSTATRTNVDANFYQNQLVSAITKAMDAERSRISIIIEGKKGAGIDEHSADEMIRLTNEYHQTCSFQKGMQLLLDAAVNKEGTDRIIQNMNLRTTLNTLDQQINAMGLIKGTEAEAQLTELIKKRGEVALQLVATSQNEATVSVPSE